ncbi:hypothetical protein MLD38_013841 [Melastoma candidum]|nr:hypothetical protein MLD38_013841 [Melastoma candidum]
MLGVGAVPSVLLALTVLIMPESPRWLVMQGRLGDAKRVLQKTSESPQEAELRLSDIKEAAGIPLDCNNDVVQVTRKKSHGEGIWRELLICPTPAVRHVMIAAVGIHFFQQSSGIDAVVLYSPTIFARAGIKSSDHKLLATIAVGFCKTSFILVATFLLDRVGRRPLILTSIGGMILSLIALGTGLTVVDHSTPNHAPMWAIVLCITTVMTFVATFSIGLGPIAWVYSSEIFPLRLRAQGASIAVGVNRATSGLISMTFLSLSGAITTEGAFYLFASVAAISWVFFYTMMPETQGRTLEEMEYLFGRYAGWRSAAKELEMKRKWGGGIGVDNVTITTN